MEILSYKEEQKLNKEEREKYLGELREFCKKRKLTNTTKGATTIAPKLKIPTETIARIVTRTMAGGEVEVVVDGVENIEKVGGAVLFASTHQGMLDGFVWMPYCPIHTLLFHGSEVNKLLLLAQLNTGMILLSKHAENSENRLNAKLDLISLLMRGHSVFMCPEGTWNLSPNKLHLPLNFGFLDAAQKSKRPIIPVVIEYTYDTSSEKERIVFIHVRYGEAIYVSEGDNYVKKLEEYKEKIATIRWDLIEEKGIFSRSEITNKDYINYMKGNLQKLAAGNVDIEVDNKEIYGAKTEVYQFQHIADIQEMTANNAEFVMHARRLLEEEVLNDFQHMF